MRCSFALVVVVACRSSAPGIATTDAATSSSSAPHPCASIVASYDALVSAGGACATNGDCACFNGGVSPKSACGGITDHATAAKLETLRMDYEHDACDALMCAAWTCNPKCAAGKCANTTDARAASTAPPRAAPSWTACTSDADCTYVSLGCCDTTPVNRAHAADAQRKLDRSGHPYCAPKAACGPSANGTWSGAAGKCAAGNCVLRSM
jgi:hypothetical protein